MTRPKLEPVQLYVALVSIASFAIASFILSQDLGEEVHAVTPAIAILMLLTVVGEMYPIRVGADDDSEEVTTSTAFMLATLLLAGPALAMVAQVAASLLSDLRTRPTWWKATFNASQYAISIAGASAVAVAIAPDLQFDLSATFSIHHFVAALAAGLTWFLLNNLFVVVALSLSTGASIIAQIRENLGFHTATTIVLIAQGPLIALAASRSIVWVLLFLPGVWAVYRTALISVAKEKLATHDALTGLPNRLLLRDRLLRMIAQHDPTNIAVMLVDLDGFKEVNDTLGHHVGDALLCQVGQRLRDGLGESFVVARLGGDEFAIVGRVADRWAAAEVGNRVLGLLQQPFALQELPFHIEASVGGALYPEHATDVDTLLQKADVAMYLAKERGTGYESYSANTDRYSPRRLALLGELRRAIEQDELVLQYQPIADMQTGAITRVEALVRWNHPEHGMLQPGEFIPLAEPTGLMGGLTRHVLDLAIAQCRRWADAGLDLSVSVNVSARNLHQSELHDDVAALLDKWSVPASALELEVTESVVMADPRRATDVLHRLNALGVATILDDFGTGYSSLAYLKRLPVTQLKIDRSFIMNMATDPEDAAIVSSTIELAKSLGLRVVAEGIESETVWDQLHQLGCHYGQGYYLSRPVAADQLTRWLQVRNERTRARTEPLAGTTNVNGNVHHLALEHAAS